VSWCADKVPPFAIPCRVVAPGTGERVYAHPRLRASSGSSRLPTSSTRTGSGRRWGTRLGKGPGRPRLPRSRPLQGAGRGCGDRGGARARGRQGGPPHVQPRRRLPGLDRHAVETDGRSGLAMHDAVRGLQWDDPLRAPGCTTKSGCRTAGTYHIWRRVRYDSQADDSCSIGPRRESAAARRAVLRGRPVHLRHHAGVVLEAREKPRHGPWRARAVRPGPQVAAADGSHLPQHRRGASTHRRELAEQRTPVPPSHPRRSRPPVVVRPSGPWTGAGSSGGLADDEFRHEQHA
jgi:hypothetical protein